MKKKLLSVTLLFLFIILAPSDSFGLSPLFFIICDALSGRESKLVNKSIKLQE